MELDRTVELMEGSNRAKSNQCPPCVCIIISCMPHFDFCQASIPNPSRYDSVNHECLIVNSFTDYMHVEEKDSSV